MDPSSDRVSVLPEFQTLWIKMTEEGEEKLSVEVLMLQHERRAIVLLPGVVVNSDEGSFQRCKYWSSSLCEDIQSKMHGT
jgi:hypothetical protein